MRVYTEEKESLGNERGKESMVSIKTKRIILVFFIILFGFSMLTTWVEAAVKICIPEGGGAPGYGKGISRLPNWWNYNLGPPYYDTNLDDPRWVGAFKQNLGDVGSAKPSVSFRAIHYTDSDGTKYLYLSWHAKVVPSLNHPYLNKVFVGICNPNGSGDDVVIETWLLNGTAVEAKEEYDLKVYHWSEAIDNWTERDKFPCLDKTRVWVETSPNTWAFQMRIEMNRDGLNIDDNFLMWYDVMVGTDSDEGEGPPCTWYSWPDGKEYFSYRDCPDPAESSNDDWGEVMLTKGTSNGCQGITILKKDIGTRNPDKTEILFNEQNIFFAEPQNLSGNEVSKIKARFRIANWGIQALNSDEIWDDIADENGVPKNGGITIGDGKKGIIEFPYTLEPCQKCEYESYYEKHKDECDNRPEDPTTPGGCDHEEYGKKRSHQCLLVDLIGPSGVTFLNDSVYNNMDFVKASEFTHCADINVTGLPATALIGGKYYVYLYLETLNMPGSMKDIDTKRKELNDEMSYEKIADIMATYLVHAYYDTGRRKVINGVHHPILRPMTSFGYFVEHKGDLKGWKYSLDGDLEEIAPNFYRIAIGKEIKRTFLDTHIVSKEFRYDLGVQVQLGLSDAFDPYLGAKSRLGINLFFEYLTNQHFSIGANLGYHNFDGGEMESDLDIFQVSVNGRYSFKLSQRLRPFLYGGPGAYIQSKGKTKLGYNMGVGFDYYITNRVALGAAFNYNAMQKGARKLSTLQAGFRYRF